MISRDASDGPDCYAQATQAESDCACSGFGPVTVTCCPLPFGARPYDALNRLSPIHWVDIMERALFQTALNLIYEWLEHFGVRRLNQLGDCKTLRLRLKGHVAQIRLDVLAEREVESSVDPGGDSFSRGVRCRHFAS